MLELPPLSLYIHIPWCVRKCPYCDFNSHEVGGTPDLPEAEYLAALRADLEDSARYAQHRKLKSIFFGGGTPSIVSADTIATCIEMADQIVGVEIDAEITMEANPGTFEQEKFCGFRQAGVNRLSIGIQSLNEGQLRSLGRIHNADEAENALAMARAAGFDNINLDLMYGLPNQTLDGALSELEQLITLEPEHISWYELTIEPNTEFFSRPPERPDDDLRAAISDAGIALLAAAGYKRYETSAYAKNNQHCVHNMNYWEFGDYLGIGAGAHEKVTLPSENRILRRAKTRLPKHFIERIGSRVSSEQVVAESDLPFEFCMNALRLIEGVPASLYLQRTGQPLEHLQRKLPRDRLSKLVDCNAHQIKTTALGAQHLNAILETLLD